MHHASLPSYQRLLARRLVTRRTSTAGFSAEDRCVEAARDQSRSGAVDKAGRASTIQQVGSKPPGQRATTSSRDEQIGLLRSLTSARHTLTGHRSAIPRLARDRRWQSLSSRVRQARAVTLMPRGWRSATPSYAAAVAASRQVMIPSVTASWPHCARWKQSRQQDQF